MKVTAGDIKRRAQEVRKASATVHLRYFKHEEQGLGPEFALGSVSQSEH
jgi:hypothetical protein